MSDESRRSTTWIVVAVVLALSWIAVALVMARGFVETKRGARTIEVVGSAKKQIRSDLVSWTGTFTAQARTMKEAYGTMKEGAEKVGAYLKERGIGEKELVFSSISTTIIHAQLPNGRQTNRIEAYKLSQDVEIRSTDVDKIAGVARRATELINEGVEFQSGAPRYYYTKIADLKIEVLSLAAKDARLRADKIAENTGARVACLSSANMGVFQITAVNSTEVSDLGMYDTTSIDKEIMAVLISKFELDR